MAQKKNAVERQITRLAAQWNEFAEEADPRLLRWLADSDNASLVLGFVEQERSGNGKTPDLFLRFETPFKQPETYSEALVKDFLQLYEQLQSDEEIRPEMDKAGVKLDWKGLNQLGWNGQGSSKQGNPGMTRFVDICTSFQLHYRDLFLHLAVALTPQQISRADQWQKWLLELVRQNLPTHVRFLVLDAKPAPFLEELARAEPARVRSMVVQADMDKLAQQVLRETGGDGPGVAFRRFFFDLTQAKDVPTAQRLAESALAIAQAKGWLPLQVAVQVALGTTCLQSGDRALALSSYQKAAELAKSAAEQGDPTGSALLVQSRLAEAGVHRDAGRFPEAARVYEEAATVASERGDPLMALEGWRMAAYCHEAAGAIDQSWNCGSKALEVGPLLDVQIRPNSTLPFAGQGLLRLTKHRAYANRGNEVRQRLTELVGPDWESKVGAATP